MYLTFHLALIDDAECINRASCSFSVGYLTFLMYVTKSKQICHSFWVKSERTSQVSLNELKVPALTPKRVVRHMALCKICIEDKTSGYSFTLSEFQTKRQNKNWKQKNSIYRGTLKTGVLSKKMCVQFMGKVQGQRKEENYAPQGYIFWHWVGGDY